MSIHIKTLKAGVHKGLTLHGALNKRSLKGYTFVDCDMINVKLTDCSLSEATFINSHPKIFPEPITGQGQDLRGRTITEKLAEYRDCNLDGAVFIGDHSYTKFINCSQVGTDYSQADIYHTEGLNTYTSIVGVVPPPPQTPPICNNGGNYGKDYTGQDWTGKRFTNVEFDSCTLIDVNFSNVSLYGVIFNGCDLTGVDLSTCSMEGVEFVCCAGAPNKYFE